MAASTRPRGITSQTDLKGRKGHQLDPMIQRLVLTFGQLCNQFGDGVANNAALVRVASDDVMAPGTGLGTAWQSRGAGMSPPADDASPRAHDDAVAARGLHPLAAAPKAHTPHVGYES